MNSANDSQIHKTSFIKPDSMKPSTSWNFTSLTKTDAHRILNSLKDGGSVPMPMIDYALMLTGDLRRSAWRKRQTLDREFIP